MRVKIYSVFLFFSLVSVSAQEKLELFFDFNKSEINVESKFKLDSLILNYKNIQIVKLHGYSDKVDNNKYNDSLSLKRAEKVYEYFKLKSIAIEENIEIKGFGENFKQSIIQSENRKVIVYYDLKSKTHSVFNKNNEIENSRSRSNKKEDFSFDLIETEQILTENIKKSSEGDLIRLNHLNFYLNSEKLIKESEPILLTLLDILKNNPKLIIEIQGHICCNRNPNDVKLSFRRAKFVFDYLIKNGIPTSRLGYKGFGSSRPIYALPEKNDEERVANRRVEILIVKN